MRRLLIAFAVLLIPAGAAAQDSVNNGSAAVRASAEATTDLAASGVQTASAAAVLPASAAAAGSAVAGSVTTSVGQGLVHAAGEMSQAAGDSAAFGSAPLTVTRQVIVAPQGPPRVPYDARSPQQP